MSANNQETPNLAGIEKHEPTLPPLASKDSSPSPDLPSKKQEEDKDKRGIKEGLWGGSFLKDLHKSDSDNEQKDH
jgi:hypothetical protein